MNKNQIEKAIKAKFNVRDLKMEKDGVYWWFILESDHGGESDDILTSYTKLDQNSLEEWVHIFQIQYTYHFGFSPTLKG